MKKLLGKRIVMALTGALAASLSLAGSSQIATADHISEYPTMHEVTPTAILAILDKMDSRPDALTAAMAEKLPVFFPVNSPEVKALLELIYREKGMSSGSSGDAKVEAIYAWIYENMYYGDVNMPSTLDQIKGLLAKGRVSGVCAHFSNVAVTLLRSPLDWLHPRRESHPGSGTPTTR